MPQPGKYRWKLLIAALKQGSLFCSNLLQFPVTDLFEMWLQERLHRNQPGDVSHHWQVFTTPGNEEIRLMWAVVSPPILQTLNKISSIGGLSSRIDAAAVDEFNSFRSYVDAAFKYCPKSSFP